MGVVAYALMVLGFWGWWAGHAPFWIALLAAVPAAAITGLTALVMVFAFLEEVRKDLRK